MKSGLIIFFIKRAIQDIFNNRFLHAVTITTIALSILIVSAFGLFLSNAGDIMDSWKKGIRIMAYLDKDVESKQIAELEQKILDLYGVADIRFISKAEALQQLKAEMNRQTSLFEDLKENPLPDVFEVQMMASTQNWEKIEVLAVQIERLPHVGGVEYGQHWLGRVIGIFNLFKFTGIVMACIFFMASVLIVANTIRLLFYSRQQELEIMRLVGATDGFIKAPFYIESVIQGILGGITGILVLFVIFWVITSNVEQDFSAGFFKLRFLTVGMSL